MSDRDAIFQPRSFRDPDASGPLTAGAAAGLLSLAGDVCLILDDAGTILDVAISSPDLADQGMADWRGRSLHELVTEEGRPKISIMVSDARAGTLPRWRQVTHSMADGDLPVRYACLANGDRIIAIGRDLRAAAAVQQRLLQAQQSLERDYLRLRQAESRYRLLFDISDEPVLIIDAASRRIAEANPAAHALVGAKPGALIRQPIAAIAAPAGQEPLIAYLGAAAAAAQLAPESIALAGGAKAWITARPFRQDRAPFLLVRLSVAEDRGGASGAPLDQVIALMPDAFVLTDRRMAIVAANAAFVELAEAVSADALIGEPLANWLGRPAIDLELIAGQLREHGVARNVATVLRGAAGSQEEVEVSAVAVETEAGTHHGFTIRCVARRLRDLPPTERDLPRSVEQLTELVGRVSLKEIVRESTDLIERLCIEAALSYTSDNRASAAEILGLSRQSLYSKLHRHGLGNLIDDRE